MSEDDETKCPPNSFRNLLKRSGRQISEKLKFSSPTKDDSEYIKESQSYADLVKFQKKFKTICLQMVSNKIEEVIELARNELDESRNETFKSLVKYNNDTLVYISHIYEFAKAIQQYHYRASIVYMNILSNLDAEYINLEKHKADKDSVQVELENMSHTQSDTVGDNQPLDISTQETPESNPEFVSCEFSTNFSSSFNVGLRKMVVVSTYEATNPNHLSAHFGEHIIFLEIRDEGWYLVKNKRDQIGIIPSTHVEFMD